jgi:hypothetical protein
MPRRPGAGRRGTPSFIQSNDTPIRSRIQAEVRNMRSRTELARNGRETPD